MRAIIPNPERNLIDGQFVTAIIQERKEEPRLVVPQAALQVDQSGYYALVVTDQHKVEQRRVQTGPNLGTDVVVTSGRARGRKRDRRRHPEGAAGPGRAGDGAAAPGRRLGRPP